MKIKDNYVIQNIAGEYLVVPLAEEADRLHGVLSLNETGAFLWNCLTNNATTEEELRDAFMREYRGDSSTIEKDIKDFLSELESIGCLEL